MSQRPPPATRYSDDGQWWWDGTEWRPAISPDRLWRWTGYGWVPAQGPPTQAPGPPRQAPQPTQVSANTSNTRALMWAGATFLVVAIGVAIWYFGFYDTAAGRCSRGDLGACVVYYAQTQASASAAAAAAQKCVVGPADQSHDVRLVVSGSDAASSDCATLAANGWAPDYVPNGDTQVCSFTLSNGTTVVVWDSGGQYYGNQACHALAQNQLPNWTGS